MKKRVTDPSHPLFDHTEYAMMCQGKVRHDTKWDANYAIQTSPDRKKLSFYHCPYCDGFHLTHT